MYLVMGKDNEERKGRRKVMIRADNIRAVVFDMDGVIFDSERLYRKHWMITGKEYGIPKDKMEYLCDRMAGATRENNEKLMKSHFGDDFDYDSFRMKTMDRMDAEIERDGLELKQGVKELFAYLKEQDYRIALATSTIEDRAKRNLTRAGILEVFDSIVYGGIVPHGKPAPDIYIEACKRLGVRPEEAMGIEDSINGVKSSAAAGLYTVMVIDLIQPTEETEKLAHEIHNSLLEVLEQFQNGHVGRTAGL